MAIAIGCQAVTDFLNQNPHLARLFETAIDASDSGLALAKEERRLTVVR